MGAVVRLTGLSEHLLRAWERRHGAVRPGRTAGGSRRYSETDVARLKLLRAGVEAGHSIGELAPLPDPEIRRRVQALRPPPTRPAPGEDALAAALRLDMRELERLLAIRFAALGPASFAREVAQPLLQEVGRRWEVGELSVAVEHLVSAVTRSLLGVALRSPAHGAGRAPLVFATPSGERHEFGILMAALVSIGAGAEALYLGPDLPAGEVARAVRDSGAAAVGLGLVVLGAEEAVSYVHQLRGQLPDAVPLWLGGPASERLGPPPAGVERLADFDQLEQRVALLDGIEIPGG